MITLAFKTLKNDKVIITASFTDENDDAVIPNTITWKLTDGAGNIINGRGAVSVDPASSVSILVSGDDLPWNGQERDDEYSIYMRIDAPYDSDDLGSDVPNSVLIEIPIENDLTAS